MNDAPCGGRKKLRFLEAEFHSTSFEVTIYRFLLARLVLLESSEEMSVSLTNIAR